MINPKLLALLGVVLIVIGVFLPLAIEESAGNTETLKFWDYDDTNDLAADGIGVYLLAIALVGGLVVLVDRADYVWVPVILLGWYIVYQLPSIWSLNRNELGFTPGAGWLLLMAGTWLLSAPLLWPVMTSNAVAAAKHNTENTTASGFNLLLVLRWAGLVLLVGGFFVPLAKINEQLTFYIPNTVNGSLFVQIALILAVAALAVRRAGVLWVIGLIILLVLGNDLRVVAQRVDQTSAGALRWGWLMLFDGAAVLALTFFLSEDRKHVGGLLKEFFAPEIDLDAEDDADDQVITDNVNDEVSEDTPDTL